MIRQPLRVIVIGGGFAGLRAAVSLADAGLPVTVIEGRNSLGGRARSFTDPVTGEVVDNGQHLFIAAYRETRKFLGRLSTEERLVFQDRLRVKFAEAGGKTHLLDCPGLPSPWHLFFGMLRLGSLTLGDKLALARVFRAVAGFDSAGKNRFLLDEQTVEEWLIHLGQSERSRRVFWYPLAVATLNELPEKASALGLAVVLKEMIYAPSSEARLGVPSVGLSELYTPAAKEIIESAGGKVLLNSPAASIEIRSGWVCGVRLASGALLECDALVSAVPPSALSRLLPSQISSGDPSFSFLAEFRTAPIVSVNLWLDKPVTGELFVGLIGTKMAQWFFNKPAILERAGIRTNYVALIISAAHREIDLSNEQLIAGCLEDMVSCFPRLKGVKVVRSQVVREREATVSLSPGMERCRPGCRSSVANLFLAGDWTDTGLPATIESAVVSGFLCAHVLLKELASHQTNGKIAQLSHGPKGLPETEASPRQ